MKDEQDDFRDELRAALKGSGISPTALSKRIGRGKDFLRDFLAGRKQSLKGQDIAKIKIQLELKLTSRNVENAPHFNVPSLEKLSQTVELSIKGIVEADTWRKASVVNRAEKQTVTRDPAFEHAEQFLFRVRGESMGAANPPIKDGATIHCVDWKQAGLTLKSGMLVVVRRMDERLEEVSARRVEIDRSTILLHSDAVGADHAPIKVRAWRDEDGYAVEILGLIVAVTNKVQY